MRSGGRTRASVAVVLVSGLALLGAPAHAAGGATTTTSGAAATPPVVGVTRTTVTVAGVVGGEATAVGADVGARARFTRANRRGGVAGRTVEYSTTAGSTSVSELAGSVFAVVPAARPGPRPGSAPPATSAGPAPRARRRARRRRPRP